MYRNSTTQRAAADFPLVREAKVRNSGTSTTASIDLLLCSRAASLNWNFCCLSRTFAGAYESGDEYRFYRDLKTIVGFAAAELFITDNYLDTQRFDVYMENVASSVSVRVMTETVSTALRLVADKFAKRGSFELRSSKDIHDRVVFADDRCWVIGQSIKDAAKMKGIYESIWATGTLVVRS
jgi:hypothetical protein